MDISSAGNSGHGYGTIGLPNASPFGITVGATTNNVFVGYGPFKDEPRFGNTTTHYNDVVDFSSRGPSVLGDPKPDLMSIGAHGFVPSSVIKLDRDSKIESFSLFGGTSMAAPVVAGVAAVLRSYYPSLTAAQVKEILESSSVPQNVKVKKPGSDDIVPFSSLSKSGGVVNLYNAVQKASTVKGKKKMKKSKA